MLTSRQMLVFSRLVLVAGSISLLFAASKLFRQAIQGEHLELLHLAWMIPLALGGGWAKAHFVMRKRMRANAIRIRNATGRLWPWQLYPPQLLAFIGSMILIMAILKRVYAHDGLVLGLLGGVDLAVAMALITSSSEYGRK
jgi:hypothetical protein